MQRSWGRKERREFRTVKGQCSWNSEEESLVGEEAWKAGRGQPKQAQNKDLEHYPKSDERHGRVLSKGRESLVTNLHLKILSTWWRQVWDGKNGYFVTFLKYSIHLTYFQTVMKAIKTRNYSTIDVS